MRSIRIRSWSGAERMLRPLTEFDLLWAMVIRVPMAYCVQEMTVRLGAVTKRGHAEATFGGLGVRVLPDARQGLSRQPDAACCSACPGG